jgi:hypothetical protein
MIRVFSTMATVFAAGLIRQAGRARWNGRGPGQVFDREPVPDETTVCRFRHLLEAHDLGRRLFDEVQRHLAAKGLEVATGTITSPLSSGAACTLESRRCPDDRHAGRTSVNQQSTG